MSENWSKEELHAAVDAYIEMQRKERKGEPFTKKNYYENLAAKFGRTEKAFEYRMQNISYVMTLLGKLCKTHHFCAPHPSPLWQY